jgi:hypothetical protein
MCARQLAQCGLLWRGRLALTRCLPHVLEGFVKECAGRPD